MSGQENIPYLRTGDEARREAYRLSAAARIAAGLCANHHACEGQDWQGEIARAAYSIAGKIMRISETGGC